MDSKEQAIVAVIHERIRARVFNESDVLSLLVVARQYAEPNTPVRELGDFVAHRERDRGVLHRYLQHLCEFRDALLAGRRATLRSATIFDTADLHGAFASVLNQFDLPPLSEAQVSDLLVCAMCILQQVQLMESNQQIGRLMLARTETEVLLLGLVPAKNANNEPISLSVPALAVANSYCGGPPGTTPEIFQELVEARCFQDKLRFYINSDTGPSQVP
jgi:hypothetical protein